jgi:hypothetical protein
MLKVKFLKMSNCVKGSAFSGEVKRLESELLVTNVCAARSWPRSVPAYSSERTVRVSEEVVEVLRGVCVNS